MVINVIPMGAFKLKVIVVPGILFFFSQIVGRVHIPLRHVYTLVTVNQANSALHDTLKNTLSTSTDNLSTDNICY